MHTYYSNEIVFRGHPDKVCDQISAAILQNCLRQDENTRAGIEVAGGKGVIFITGEVTTSAKINVEEIVKQTLFNIGYDPDAYEIINNIGLQSRDIAMGVDVGGAGDQGMMFGYACNETREKLPKAMMILKRFARMYDEIRQGNSQFLPDGKAQITGEYDECGRLIKIKDFVVSYQNTEENREFTDEIIESMVEIVCDEYTMEYENLYINPTGRFCIGGFEGDAGLTGRKIVVDAYQSFANVGGGCMNGKDPTKVDFSAAHMARRIACEQLQKHDLTWCEVQLSYAIGMAEPLAIYIKSNAGNIEPEPELFERCKPQNIIKELQLTRFNYIKAAAFGHFG